MVFSPYDVATDATRMPLDRGYADLHALNAERLQEQQRDENGVSALYRRMMRERTSVCG